MDAVRRPILLLVAILVAAFTVAAAAPSPSSSPFRTVYAFGDSFTDTGNTHSTTGPYSFGYVSHPPYGATFFHRSTNRYSDGRLVVDFLAADALRLPSFLPPYLSTSSAAANASSNSVNFAVAGATAIEHEWRQEQPQLRHHAAVHHDGARLAGRAPQDAAGEQGQRGRGAVLGRGDRGQRLRLQLHGGRHHPAQDHPDHGRRQGHHLHRGVAEERGQVRGRAGAAAHGLPDDGHDASQAGRPRRPGLRRLGQPAEPRPQPRPPGQPPPAPAEPPGRRHCLRRLLRRAPRRHEEPGQVRLRGALQGLLRVRRRRLQLRRLRHLRLPGGPDGVRPAGPLRQLGRRPHDGGHVQGRRRHVLPGRRREVLPAGVRLLAGQERPR